MKDKMKMMRESIGMLDLMIYGLIAGFCFISYQHWDILHTGASSIAYLNGHFLDFYDYNKTKVGGNSYMPTTYIIFAVWNIPIRLLGFIKEPTFDVGAFVRMWYKLGTFLLFLGTAYLIYKICITMAVGQKQAVFIAFLFLSSPIAVYSELIFGQYDIITTFFMCLGYYYYLKEDRKRFVISFAIAVTCKYFALLVFVPLLLLKEKDVWKIIRDMAGVAGLFVLEMLIYAPSGAFSKGVIGFEVTSFIFNVSLDNGKAKTSVVVVLWLLLCAAAYFKECREEEYFPWSIYFSCGVMFLSFGLSSWHPQWLLMAVPFLTLGMAFHKKADIYLLLDLMLSGAFILYVVNEWYRHCDQNLFSGGIFKKYVTGIVGENMTMSDLLFFKDKNLIFSAFAGLLLVYVVFVHPKMMCRPKQACCDMKKAIFRLRYIGGCCFFIVPSIICLFINFVCPRVIYAGSQENLEVIGAMNEGDIYEQVFTAEKEEVTGISAEFGTFGQANRSILKCELIQKADGAVLNEMQLDTSKLKDNEYIKFDFSKASKVTAGQQYSIRITAESILPEDHFTLYRTQEEPDDLESYAVVNYGKTNYDLSIKVFGR